MMADEAPAQAPEGQPAPEAEAEVGETDWKAESRKWEKRARENTAAANRLAEIEEQQKTAEQKAAEREAAAEARAVEAEQRALRREVALEHSLSKDDAALLDAISDEDAMRALAKRLAGQDKDKRKTTSVPTEGTTNPTPGDDRRAFVRQLTGRE